MSTAEAVLRVLNSIRIVTAALVGDTLFAWGLYKDRHTARVKAQKILNDAVALGKAERMGKRGSYAYRVIGCKSEMGEHARIISEHGAKILSKYPEAKVSREVKIPDINRRADLLALLVKNGNSACVIVEAINSERQCSVESKIRDWNSWPGATEFLSQHFGCSVPSFSVLTHKQLEEILEG